MIVNDKNEHSVPKLLVFSYSNEKMILFAITVKVEKPEISEPLQRYYDLVTGAVLGSDTEALKVRHINSVMIH